MGMRMKVEFLEVEIGRLFFCDGAVYQKVSNSYAETTDEAGVISRTRFFSEMTVQLPASARVTQKPTTPSSVTSD